MKILLSAVGKRDPFAVDPESGEKSLGPLLTVAQEIKPDILIMFPTRRQLNEKLSFTEDRCEEIEEQLKSMMPKTAIRTIALDLPDPTDHHEILIQLRSRIEEIKKYYQQSQTDYYINISSSTPQIQASFLILVSSQKINADVYQAIDPRYVEAGQERVRKIDVQFIEEENQITRAKIFYDKYYFASAADELTNLALATRKAEREKMAEIYADLFYAYHLVDLYQHERALGIINKVVPAIERLRRKQLLSWLKKQQHCLTEIVALGQKEGYANLCDLYHNTCRRLAMGQYVDCLSRFKRIYEGCYYYIAREELGIARPENKLEDQRQLDWVAGIINRKQGRMYIYDIAKIYKAKKGRNKLSDRLEQSLNSLAKQRNYTINNHGMQSVNHEDARRAVDLLKELLQQVFPGREIDDYPFSGRNIEEVGKIVFQDI